MEDILKKLADDTGDCVHFVVLSEKKAIIVDRYMGDNTLQVAQPIGKPLPLHIGAGPKLLLAYLPEQQRKKIINEISYEVYTPNTIPDVETLICVLNRIVLDGYSFDDQEYEIGVYACGAPVFDHTGTVVASVSVALPAVRYQPEMQKNLIDKVVVASMEISSRLGYHPGTNNNQRMLRT